MGNNGKKGLALRAGTLAVVSVLFLLVFSIATSPLTKYYGADSAFFILVGQGMTKGMLPYRDFFDMKGPYLFLIEYIGQLICYGRTGAFIVQCLNLFVSLWIVDCIFRMMVDKPNFWKEMAMMLPWLLVASFTFNAGNLTEEYSLPWLLLTVYFTLAYFKQSDRTGNWQHPVKIGFYYGFAFGVLALIRITNAAMIGAAILTISVGLLIKKEWKNLLSNAGAFLLGCVAAFVPMCLFYGCHGLLGEMLHQVFVFGVQYSLELSMAEKLARLIAIGLKPLTLCAMLPVLVLAVFRVKNWRYWVFSLSALGLLLAATAMGNSYRHYLTLGIPNLTLGLGLLAAQMGRQVPLRRKTAENVIMGVLLAGLLVIQLPFLRYQIYFFLFELRAAGSDTEALVTDIVETIPEEDRSRVYAYGMDSCSNWYFRAGLFPSHRYCDWQAHYIELNPAIGDELEDWLAAESPGWIVTPAAYSITPDQIADVISTHYHEFARNEDYVLYTANSNTEKESEIK